MSDAPDERAGPDVGAGPDEGSEPEEGAGPDGDETAEGTGAADRSQRGGGRAPDAAEGLDPDAAGDPEADADGGEEDVEALRRRVEEQYDFDDFGPAEMAEMSVDEWQAAFDADAWVTGEDLLDRLEADLRDRVARRDVFAVVERVGGAEPRLVAYSDAGYAVVHGDGSVEGEGTVLRDVKPSVALASMPEYEVPDPPADAGLPAPGEVPEQTGGLGNAMLQLVAVAMLLAGVGLLVAPLVVGVGSAWLVATVAGLGFLLVGVVLLFAVANARLSGRFRAEEYRERLRAAGVEDGERPEFLPVDDAEFED